MTTDTSHSPEARYRSPGINDIRWTEGFWKDKTDLCSQVILPDMLAKLRDADLSHCWANFLIAAGRMEGDHQGPPFHDGDFYKWLEAACYSQAVRPDGEIRSFIEQAVDLIREIQEDNGYVFTQRAIHKRLHGQAPPPLENDINFEVYNLGHLMTTACVHFRVFGTGELLEAAEKAAGYLDKVFAEVKPELAKTAVCPSHYMGLAELCRTTGDDRWLDLLERLLALRDAVAGGTDDNQDRQALAEHREIVGHAVRANYLYAGAADLILEGRRLDLVETLDAVWRDLTTKKMYITGSCGALYDGVSPYGSWDYDGIQRIHQAYGRAYELPNTTAYNETCAAIGGYLWNWRMFLRSGQAQYIDLMETILYNGALAGVSLDGRRYFYVNALRRQWSLPFDLKWSRSREPYITSFCCPPNLLRTLAETASFAYALGKDDRHPEIRVLFYGSNQATLTLGENRSVIIRQKTNFPWDGEVRLDIESIQGSGHFGLSLRIPPWAEDCSLRLNGAAADLEEGKDGFATIRREWETGDRLELVMPMKTRVWEAHPMVEELTGQICVIRGPLVYCLESADLPDGIDIAQVSLNPQVHFVEGTSVIDGETITTLEATAWVRNRNSSPKETGLYQPSEPLEAEQRDVRLIPYYAWDNRGFGEMSVWLQATDRGSDITTEQ